MFLHVLAHDVKNRVIQREFVRSGEIVSQHFNLILLVVIRLHNKLLKKLQPVTNTCINPQWKCFEDGTYIKVNVLQIDRPRIRSRLAHSPRCACTAKRTAKFYYMCNAGYLNTEGFFAPYRGQRYHLQEWRGIGNAPTISKEEMANADDLEDIDEGDSTYAMITGDDIHYIETSNEWTQCWDESAATMFNE
ncbi:putative nuclease HARBI1 [Cucumis melo var. makuwa]|uniref:Nuclease HARBI1 n=1 Tax=Cucumis melo var. makuwa TaxID=1194695 RepID=A0A5A7UFI9_CUCMM|nr:putative nuclease HARBI1 [Cucumis melo var. makuwa]TYK20706.1 putative nuclease HARBI1 [Cucumis melo var. makuwa]